MNNQSNDPLLDLVQNIEMDGSSTTSNSSYIGPSLLDALEQFYLDDRNLDLFRSDCQKAKDWKSRMV